MPRAAAAKAQFVGATCSQSASTRSLSWVGSDLPISQLRAVWGVTLRPQYRVLNSSATLVAESRTPAASSALRKRSEKALVSA